MDPLALLSYALAAAGGRVDTHEVSALVAAGTTLLQRSALLVRALAGRRAAVLLPPSPAWLVALAASDGRGLVVFDSAVHVTTEALRAHDVGAVFTSRHFRSQVPEQTTTVVLDEAPRRAVVQADGRIADVDLGTHFALDLYGDLAAPGSPEECLRFADDAGAPHHALSHAQVLDAARAEAATRKLTPLHVTRWASGPLTSESLIQTLVAPLLVGGTVRTGDAPAASP